MTQKDLNIIHATARGFAQALELLTSDYGDHALAEAMCQLQEPGPRVLRSADVGYYAAMILAWQQRGRPDVFT